MSEAWYDWRAKVSNAWATAGTAYAAGGTLPPVPAPAYIYRATVIGWHDGDTGTFAVSVGFDITFTTNVRLLGMNARELAVPGGKEARDNLRALLPPGTAVTITSASWDKYGGRADATVTYLGADGQPHDLVGDLIADGWGAPYGGAGPMPVPQWPRTVGA
jgi:endonuclease YncB( thermonuclease family)